MSTASPRAAWTRPTTTKKVWPIFLLIAATLAVYANTFRVPFVFDDQPAIVDNASIRHLWPLTDVLLPRQAGGLTVSGRPLVNLSLAINYAISGDAVWSYHVVNVLIHLAAGLLLFGIVRRTLQTPPMADRWQASSLSVALGIAGLWLLHPLQTESVTYVVQRAESLAGLFYLLTVYCFIRGAIPDEPPSVTARTWFIGSVVACGLGMASKEVVVSAPLIVWLYDRTFISGTFREAWERRRPLLVGLGATWFLLALLVIGTGGRGGTAGFASGVSPWSYALTQCRAIVQYLALSLWPASLVFDYGLGTVHGVLEVLPQALLIIGLLAATLVALRRAPALGFLGAWFFALLAPSSSFVPVVTQTIAEHRMYLPLAAVVTALVVGLVAWLGARGLIAVTIAGACLGFATHRRNKDYQSEVAIWRDTAEKQPTNARAHNNLGQALFRAGDFAAAKHSYLEALRLQPKYPETHYNLAVALAHDGDLSAAIEHYELALRYDPVYPEAHNNLGNALVRSGHVAESLSHYRRALEIKPGFAEAANNEGNALLQLGRAEEAITRFQRALQLRPHYAEAEYNLGNAHASLGRMAEALAHYRRALEVQPNYADAHVNAGNALLALERPAEAVREYEAGLVADPKLAVAHLNAGFALLDLERWADAVPHFEAALRLDPALANAHRGLAHACEKLGRASDAIVHAEAYLRANPNDPAAREDLRSLRARTH